MEDDLDSLSIIFMNFNYEVKDSSGSRYKTLLSE